MQSGGVGGNPFASQSEMAKPVQPQLQPLAKALQADPMPRQHQQQQSAAQPADAKHVAPRPTLPQVPGRSVHRMSI